MRHGPSPTVTPSSPYAPRPHYGRSGRSRTSTRKRTDGSPTRSPPIAATPPRPSGPRRCGRARCSPACPSTRPNRTPPTRWRCTRARATAQAWRSAVAASSGFHSYRGENARRRRIAAQAVDLAESAGDATAMTWAYWFRVDVATFERAQSHLPAALALAHRTGADWRAPQLLQRVAFIAIAEGHYGEARLLHAEALAAGATGTGRPVRRRHPRRRGDRLPAHRRRRRRRACRRRAARPRPPQASHMDHLWPAGHRRTRRAARPRRRRRCALRPSRTAARRASPLRSGAARVPAHHRAPPRDPARPRSPCAGRSGWSVAGRWPSTR